MKVIAINGSPRSGGNTEIMLRKVFEPLEAEGMNNKQDLGESMAYLLKKLTAA